MIQQDPAELWTSFRNLWETFMAHDEVTLAEQLLKTVPWRVRNHPDLVEMRRITSAAVSHLKNPEEYWGMYENYNPNFWDGERLIPYAPDSDVYPRYQAVETFVREQLSKKQSVTVLDIGVFDGQITNRVAKATGAQCWGVDCSLGPDLANRYAQMFNTGAKFGRCRFGSQPIPADFPKQFDIVLCMEIYEHVPDTRHLLRSAADLVAPGGHLVVTTPYGSWFGGFQVPYYVKYDEPKPREHVRAPTLEDISGDLEAIGWDPIQQKSIPVGHAPNEVPVPHRATLFVVAQAKGNHVRD